MDQAAWYYDNPNNPMTIHMCPGTCNVVAMATESKLNVLVGCQDTLIIE